MAFERTKDDFSRIPVLTVVVAPVSGFKRTFDKNEIAFADTDLAKGNDLVDTYDDFVPLGDFHPFAGFAILPTLVRGKRQVANTITFIEASDFWVSPHSPYEYCFVYARNHALFSILK
nr:hypothetical protein [Ruegeria atlantica]